jgi:hypothetical protein
VGYVTSGGDATRAFHQGTGTAYFYTAGWTRDEVLLAARVALLPADHPDRQLLERQLKLIGQVKLILPESAQYLDVELDTGEELWITLRGAETATNQRDVS